MAYSKTLSESHDAITSLIECGICLSEIDDPKALPCLHSFCLKCLKEVKHPPGIFVCPSCQEKTTLPKEGVDGFKDNFFINQLKEIKAITVKGKITKPCVSCGTDSCEIVARCVECNGFTCQKCVQLHQTIAIMKLHTVFTIDELQSGSIDVTKVLKEENCQKHKDQVLRWFCKTCNIPICRDCTVMEHRHPDHDYITIESANEVQVKEIKSLMESCNGMAQQLTIAMANAEEVEMNLTKSVDDIKKQLDEEKKAFLDEIERNYKEKMDNLSQIQAEKAEKINTVKRDLHNKKSKLDNAVQLADQVITSGSKPDLASNYSTLSTTLADLQHVKVTGVSKGFSEIMFRPRNKYDITNLDLGSISALYSKDRNGKWVLEKEIGKEGPGKFNRGFGVAVNSNKDIYIADNSDNNLKIFDSHGNFKRVLQGNLNRPRDAVTNDGTHLCVIDRTSLVHVFNSQGEKVNQFPAISPDGKASDTDGSTLYGLAVDNDGNILVGNYSKLYLSKHTRDGTHISSFEINISPCHITVTPKGRVIVCPYNSNIDAEILDQDGKLLHTINKPPDAKSWYPCSACCSDDGIVYVTNYGGTNAGGIYSFTEDGTYLGCITTDVINAWAIALIDDDRLVVVQWASPAKICCYEET